MLAESSVSYRPYLKRIFNARASALAPAITRAQGRDGRTCMKVNKEKASHFNKAVGHYQCPPEEVAEMKAAYERDPEGAAVCFAAIAFHVDQMTGPAIEPEHTLTGEQFLKLGELSRETESADEK